MDQAKKVMQHYREYTRQAPDELMAYLGFIVTPDGLPVTFVLPVWTGPMGEAEKRLAPLCSFRFSHCRPYLRSTLFEFAIHSGCSGASNA